MYRIGFAGILLSLCLVTFASARSLSLTAASTGGSATGTGSDVINLVGNFIKSENEFASISLKETAASLRYGSMQNAILFTRNAAGNSANITIPSTGFSKTFSAANADDLEDDIKDFFKKENANEYAKFLRSVNEQTTLGVTDGNPLAVTALAANASFYRFGFQSPRFDLGVAPHLPAGFEVDATAGSARGDNVDTWYAGLGIGSTFALGERVAFSVNLDLQYRDVGGAAVYQVVNTDALPILLIEPGPSGGLSWTVSPAFVIAFGGSWDLAAGGFPIGGQITSSLAYRAGDWTFLMANQYGYYNGLPISVSDFKFDTDVDQSIVKNGLQVIRSFGRSFVDAGIAYTNFLNNASVDSYWTPEVGIGMRFNSTSGVRIGYHGDFGEGFTNNGADAQLYLAF